MDLAIRVRALNKTFRNGRKALDGLDLDIRPGEMVALIGASGSGKSTLLRHLAGLMPSDPGRSEISIHGLPVQQGGRISPRIRSVRSQVGFVFQQFNLVDRLPVLVNVLAGGLHRLPMWRSVLRAFGDAEKHRALDALRRVGILDCCHQRASTLSGGQQQRAAIARALVQGARVILADEPIASLDPESSRRVMDILATVNREDGCTVVVSLHQVNVAVNYCARTIALSHGRIVYDGSSAALTPALLRQLYGADADEILALGDHIGSLQDARRPPAAKPWAQPLPQAA